MVGRDRDFHIWACQKSAPPLERIIFNILGIIMPKTPRFEIPVSQAFHIFSCQKRVQWPPQNIQPLSLVSHKYWTVPNYNDNDNDTINDKYWFNTK